MVTKQYRLERASGKKGGLWRDFTSPVIPHHSCPLIFPLTPHGGFQLDPQVLNITSVYSK